MAFSGYIKIPDIAGESKQADHEEEIDCWGVSWGAAQSSSASVGSGRTRGRSVVQDFNFSKWYDAASPYLALACMQGKSFDEVVFMVRKDSGDAHIDYLQVTLTNCVVTSYQMSGSGPNAGDNDMIAENVTISAEKIKVLYVVQADDHSAGDEHEIEYDVVAGA